jgi:hypothetical protein
MRKILAFAAVAVALAASVVAFADTGSLAFTKDRGTIQNLHGVAPTVSASRCDTTTATKGVLKGYSTAGYSAIYFRAVDSAGVPVVVKRSNNTSTAYMPAATDVVINNRKTTGTWEVTKIVLSKYSTASAAVTTCVERQ